MNVPAKPRVVIKITKNEDYYVMRDRARIIQTRSLRSTMPKAIVEKISKDGVAYAWVTVGRDGRWTVRELAPDQDW
jgi:hypothetical protein